MEGIRDMRPIAALQSDFNATAARKEQVRYCDHWNDEEKTSLIAQYDRQLKNISETIKARKNEIRH